MNSPNVTTESVLNDTVKMNSTYMTERLIVSSTFLFFGVPANLLSIGLIVRAKEKKSTTTYLLLNLAIADVVNLLGIFVANLVYQFMGKSYFVPIWKSTLVPRQVANFTLAFIALERFNALVKTMSPFLALSSKTRVKRAIAAFWLIALTLNVPVSVFLLVKRKGWKAIGYSYHANTLVVIYTLPLLVILFCYSKIFKGTFFDRTILGKPVTNEAELNEKARFVRVLVIVTVVFLLTNLPVCVVKILFLANIKNTKHDLKFVLLVLSCVSSTVNPYIYGLQSERYRKQITQLFRPKKLNARYPVEEQCWDEHL